MAKTQPFGAGLHSTFPNTRCYGELDPDPGDKGELAALGDATYDDDGADRPYLAGTDALSESDLS